LKRQHAIEFCTKYIVKKIVLQDIANEFKKITTINEQEDKIQQLCNIIKNVKDMLHSNQYRPEYLFLYGCQNIIIDNVPFTSDESFERACEKFE
jgi:hypothetical protein